MRLVSFLIECTGLATILSGELMLGVALMILALGVWYRFPPAPNR